MLTAQGRRERAYDRYVRKSSQGRVKQQKRFAAKGNTMPVTHLSEPVETTEVPVRSRSETAANSSGLTRKLSDSSRGTGTGCPFDRLRHR